MPTVTCKQCQTPFEKDDKSYRQQIKRGVHNFFCTRACCSRHIMLTRHAAWRKTHTKKVYQYRTRKALSPESLSLNSIAGRIAARAREAGWPCEVNTAVLREMLWRQKGLCYYSGVRLQYGCSARGAIHPDQLSVDRKDASLGYTRDNVVLCCYWVNAAKMRMSVNDFARRVKRLAKSLSG